MYAIDRRPKNGNEILKRVQETMKPRWMRWNARNTSAEDASRGAGARNEELRDPAALAVLARICAMDAALYEEARAVLQEAKRVCSE